MNNSVSTYRLQFNKDFTFSHFEKILPYLKKLGVSTVYASPIFEATPGSVHGYDGVNPNNINPEIGTEEQLRKLSERLKGYGIQWLQDIVPNHMAFHPNNEWFMDVLEKGPQSKYASYFDVSWTGRLYHGRIMVPFLGDTLAQVLKNKELKVIYNDQRLSFQYYDSTYPLQPRSYATILRNGNQEPPQAIEQLIAQIPKMEDEIAYNERWNEFKLQLASLMKNEATKEYIEQCIEDINDDNELLSKILDEQSYRLCHWQETDQHINFRRFFTVNSLICLNIHNKEVFQHYHGLVKTLLDDGVFQGLRIDHIDGLYDPTDYLDQLRQLAGKDTYIVVEKILEPGEGLPTNWAVQGSTGYDFLSMVNNLFTNKKSEQAFTDYYKKLSGNTDSIHQQLHEKKSMILYQHMGGELENLYRLFMDLRLAKIEDYADMRTEDIKTAIAEFLIQCPVYRYYGNAFPLSENEAADVADILSRVKESRSDLNAAVSLLENVLLKKPNDGDKEFNKNVLRFYQRCMQFTGPLMAKGVEDTLMYTYSRFIGHNEVGDSPENFGLSKQEFHEAMIARQQQWPMSINATSTHDTKRGEDARARLNVLTDVVEEWFAKVDEWRKMNDGFKTSGFPDSNDEYFIYQNLLAVYPMPAQDEDNIKNRMTEYMEKALREAKTHSNWTTPNVEYEEATKQFTDGLLDPSGSFLNSFLSFHSEIADHGIINSLSQVLLKYTCPGIPDTYQGTELWDLTLVDPDNRRFIDYERRKDFLATIEVHDKNDYENLIEQLWQNRYDGQIKLWLTHVLMNVRKEDDFDWCKAAYIPLETTGEYMDFIFAFARKHEGQWYIMAVPLQTRQIHPAANFSTFDWKDTKVILPKDCPKDFKNILVKQEGKAEDALMIQSLFKPLPFALIKLSAKHTRSAGILLHITSLPSPFGIGDLGPEAYSFADMLERTHQKYWQLLPLNPTEEGLGHSPYSSLSSKAGNPLLISPELLAEMGLLTAEELTASYIDNDSKVNFKEAERVKLQLFERAWTRFSSGNFYELNNQFISYCSDEENWLNDYALFILLKKQNNGKAWFQWGDEFRSKETKALKQFTEANSDELDKIKWLQFIFYLQWKNLREYCNEKDIKFFGDMPFYISYDSVDVWSNRELFAIDDNGNMTGVAGVPPDAFSADGQLWGMPVFNWDVLKETNYKWWIERFKKNMELFDVVRLDHFRAFADYWEVPADEKTAIKGQWNTGPGIEIFNVAKKALGSLPFIAEDLGEITDVVYQLRDTLDLPGMKILQFAFGDDMPESIHIPHNYPENCIAYTGTHDNNTTKGWFKSEASEQIKKHIRQYTGTPVTEENIAPVFIRMAYASVAKTVIVPMQDLLALNETARMNTPSQGENNWSWRLLKEQITGEVEDLLKELTWTYNRR